ncbi:MAG: ATP-binding cassette domain-containing protein, partial [Holophagaceae bacterium]|nr:ATP-binding cassette domain-containing protein [Holophagaceae bacterium]
MPADLHHIKGYSPFEAAMSLLKALGQEASAAQLRERVDREPFDEDIPALIETDELRGRLIQIDARDIKVLSLPTLVQLKSGDWILVHGKHGGKWQIEGPDGYGQVELAQDHISGKAVDRLGVLPKGGNLWIRIGRLFLVHKAAIAQIVAVSVIMQALSMVSPFITRMVMDDALPQASHSLLAIAVFGVLLLTIATSALGLIRDWTNAFVETRMNAIAQRGILDHALRLPFSKLMRKTAGEIMQAFSGFSTARNLIGQRMFGIFMDAVTACGYFVLILGMWPMGAGIIIGGTVLLVVLSTITSLVQAGFQRQIVPAQIDERNSMLQLLNGVATLKAAGVERQSIDRWWTKYAKVQGLGLRLQRFGLWSEVGHGSIQQLITLSVLIEGGRQVLSGNITIGTLFAVQQMGGSLSGAILGALNLGMSFVIARPQIEKAREILSLEQEPKPSFVPPPPTFDIEIKNVCFRYSPDDSWILKDLDLSVESGSRYWLKWRSGAGKSTLLRLIGGLLEPEQGQISIGGRPAKDMRIKVAYMPQNVQIYGSSILENLKIFSCQAPMEKLLAASEKSGLAKLVKTFPMGYETVLLQSGGNVSGGQRQLVLLTAAMATERKVLLLDEAFANLDWLSKTEILQGDWFEGKTVVY